MTLQKMKRFVYAPDPHGEHVNRKSWKVLLDFCKDFKPHRRIIGGDVFDFTPFRRGASADEKEQSMEADIKAGLGLIEDLKPTDWPLGNHDIRPAAVARREKGAIKDYAISVVNRVDDLCDKLKINKTPYRADAFIELGPRLKAIHGNIANQHTAYALAIAYGCVVAGHVHIIERARAKTIDHRECWLAGCLRNPWAEFNETRITTLRHAQGFLFGMYSEDSPAFSVNIAEESADGSWLIPSAFKEYA